MGTPAVKDILFVSFQGVLFLLYLVPLLSNSFQPGAILSYAGLAVAIAGILTVGMALMQLNRNLTPFPTPKKDGNLIQTGLYKFVRHPIYSGIILTTLGYGLFQGSLWRIGIGLVLWGLFFFKSKYEEGLLRQQYPEYGEYATRTWRFFPFM